MRNKVTSSMVRSKANRKLKIESRTSKIKREMTKAYVGPK
jgi:hypothetical protein